MSKKEFCLDSGVYTLQITYYHPGDPGKMSGPPEDCYPPEAAEVEFDNKVEKFDEETKTKSTLDFDDFVTLYARECCGGDEDEALEKVENETIVEIQEGADDDFDPPDDTPDYWEAR